jgi:2',3'-cyclic-nucleotide 2'-phosphodiesterase (5'-nucleotidase family)
MIAGLTRRALGAAAGAALLGPVARAATQADLTLILMGDLHSGYAWSSRLLAAVRAEVAAASGAVRIVVNGDVFEHNNAVARRNAGLIDLALIRAFAALAPTIVTIGNHDSDLFDPREFATRMAQQGATLLTDIADPRTGQAYGASAQRIVVRGRSVVFTALGTPLLSLYPPAWRGLYRIPDPASYAAERLPVLCAGADLPVVLVHAGLVADQTVLPHLRGPFLLHGAHDHLRFSQRLGQGMHLQSGAWSNAFQVVTIRFGTSDPSLQVRDVVLGADAPQDRALQQMIADETAGHFAPADRVVLGHLPEALDLDAAVLRAAGWLREETGTDLALLSHTTFGDGLPAGPVTAYDLASFMRFDGGLSLGEIPANRIGGLLARTNQFDGRTPYARRTGDYLYATSADALPTDRPIRVAINAYAVSSPENRIAMFGWDVPGFVPLIGTDGPRTLGQVIRRGLAAG